VSKLIRKDMDINEHERISNIALLKIQIKVRNKAFIADCWHQQQVLYMLHVPILKKNERNKL
jgi:hypothetical protein